MHTIINSLVTLSKGLHASQQSAKTTAMRTCLPEGRGSEAASKMCFAGLSPQVVRRVEEHRRVDGAVSNQLPWLVVLGFLEVRQVDLGEDVQDA